MDVKTRIEQILNSNNVVLFMKGSPSFPQCGFSARAVAILKEAGATFQHVDVLEDPEIREGIKAYGNWPTIPQLYIKKELVGGSDIMLEMYQAGELQEALKS
jgi:monothiol glutaredoxin